MYFDQKKALLFATQISLSYKEQRQLCGTSPVTFAGKKKLTTLKKVTNFEKRTQSYQVLKTCFDQKKAPLFVTQKYSRLKSAIF